MSSMLRKAGVSPNIFYIGAAVSLVLSLFAWFASASGTSNQDRAQRMGIFVGLWPPTLILLGKIAEDAQTRR